MEVSADNSFPDFRSPFPVPRSPFPVLVTSFLKLDREFFCLQPSLARLYSAAASPSERRRSDGSLAINVNCLVYLIVSTYDDNWINPVLKFKKLFVFLTA